jgi:hypothetical protein
MKNNTYSVLARHVHKGAGFANWLPLQVGAGIKAAVGANEAIGRR